jgi:hypothetical protein
VGELKIGFDPEQGANQIITSVDLFDWFQLLKLPSKNDTKFLNMLPQ